MNQMPNKLNESNLFLYYKLIKISRKARICGLKAFVQFLTFFIVVGYFFTLNRIE